MKVFNGLKLSDQKVMCENLFIWDDENGEKPCKKDFKKWVLDFFTNSVAIKEYISNLKSDIDLGEDDSFFDDLNESYKRQIAFLEKL